MGVQEYHMNDESYESAEATCPMCNSGNVVTDAAGKYCTDCRSRPWETPQPQEGGRPRSVGLTVRWSKENKGYLALRNPVSGERCEIRAKGQHDKDRWIFGYLPKVKGHRRVYEADENRFSHDLPTVHCCISCGKVVDRQNAYGQCSDCG